MTKQSSKSTKANITKKDKFKDKLIHVVDRRKHTMTENLRLAAVIPVIFLIIGLFLPFLTADVTLSASSNKKDVTILDPQSPAIDISLGDFVTHKPLRQFEIFGHQLGEMQILGLNIYDTLTRPFPSFDKLNKLDQSADGQVAAFLTNENFVKFCHDHLGSAGDSIVQMGQIVNNISGPTREGLHNVTELLNRMNAASTNVRNGIGQVEDYLRLAGNILIVLCLIVAVAILLFFIHKGPRYLPAIILSVFTFIFLAIGIGVAITDVAIANALAATSQNISEGVRALIENMAPGAVNAVTNAIGSHNIHFNLIIDIFCNIGWWFITLSLIALTTLAYIVPSLKPKATKKAAITKK